MCVLSRFAMPALLCAVAPQVPLAQERAPIEQSLDATVLRSPESVTIYHPRLVGGHRTVFYTIGGKARIPGRFAIDWVRLGANGALTPDTAALRDRNGFGAEVLAVAGGVVLSRSVAL